MIRVRERVRVRDTDRANHILRRRSVDAPALADGACPRDTPLPLPLGGRRRETGMGRRCLVRARVRVRVKGTGQGQG